MSPVSPSDPSSDVPSDDDLLALAIAHAAETRARSDGGVLLRVRRPLSSRDSLDVRPLLGRHPLDALAGFTAPTDWCALGATAAGRATDVTGTRDVDVTVLVARGGGGAAVLRRGDELVRLHGRPEGAVADACRRALGLPTAPPPPTTLRLWTMCWLDRVVGAAAGSGDPHDLTWPGVARRHPACETPMSPAALAAAALALADAWPWSRLREDPAVLDLPVAVPAGRVRAWMDDGMWARWVLRALPELDDLVGACRALLPATVADAVELVVAGADPAAR